MFEWIKTHKKTSIIILIFSSLFIFIIMPMILNWMYYLDAPFDFFYVNYDISSILNYYGSVLTFIGTTILGCITIYQNYIAQKKTDEVNKLTLELQRKSMAMAEQNYKKTNSENLKNIPKFELRTYGYNGGFSNLSVQLKNVSVIIASEIKSLSLEIYTENNILENIKNNVKISNYSLSSSEETIVNFNNDQINSNKSYIVWKFQCEDPYTNIHYYKASLFIEDINNPFESIWKVKKVG